MIILINRRFSIQMKKHNYTKLDISSHVHFMIKTIATAHGFVTCVAAEFKNSDIINNLLPFLFKK
jgi:hypothetical protein